jgi:hypothetical protein
MQQRGVTLEEMEYVLNEGWNATDAKPGIHGRVAVFPYDRDWAGRVYPEKEVAVYYRQSGGRLHILTVKARYGSRFSRGEQK